MSPSHADRQAAAGHDDADASLATGPQVEVVQVEGVQVEGYQGKSDQAEVAQGAVTEVAGLADPELALLTHTSASEERAAGLSVATGHAAAGGR